MLVKRPPMTNRERQRKFRQRHPGYFKKYYARKQGAAADAATVLLWARPATADALVVPDNAVSAAPLPQSIKIAA